VDDIVKGMREHEIRALRLFPEEHRYFLDDVTWGDQMAVYQERRIPVFIRANLGKIKELLRSFPDLVVVTGSQGSNPQDRYAWPLIERYPNLCYDTSGYIVDGIIEEFCQRYGASRLLFASGFPDNASGTALLRLAHAEISETDREAIAFGNISRLLSEVVLE
jgi:predicted TIM-barrel fold metal-dependent hydrolase